MLNIKWSYPTTSYIVLAVVIFLIGGITGNAVANPNSFHFTEELSPLHGISILVSLGCVVIISILFDKYKESNKMKRACVQRKINDFNTNLDNIGKLISSPQLPDIVTINSCLKKLYQSKLDVLTVLNHTAISGQSYFENYDSDHILLRDLMTTTSIDTSLKGEPDISVIEDIVHYSTIRASEIEKLINSISVNTILEEIRIYE